VAKGFEDALVVQEECARHALHVARGKPYKIPIEPRHQHAINAFAIQLLAQLGSRQPKNLVEFAVRIGKAWKIVQLVRSEKFCGAVFGPQVHKSDGWALGLNLRTKFGQLGDRLAAKGSAKMAQKDEQEGAIR
jgi:hypothetical protein